jgi:transketolase
MKDYKAMALEARRKVLTMIHKAGTSHIASNFSVIDIATVLYDRLSKDDAVVWSKGWAAASIYYFLAQRGEIPQEDLEKFPRAPYLGLAETTVPGVLCNGGAVGHGTPIAVGIALAKRRAGQLGRVYCVMSDGELNEGTVWESLMMAMHHKLDNLCFIIDANGWQAMGPTKEICNVRWDNAFKGFGAHVGVFDGHSYPSLEMLEPFFAGKKGKGRPHVAICNTIKGKGVSFMENHLLYHYKNVDEETYQKAMAELV